MKVEVIDKIGHLVLGSTFEVAEDTRGWCKGDVVQLTTADPNIAYFTIKSGATNLVGYELAIRNDVDLKLMELRQL